MALRVCSQILFVGFGWHSERPGTPGRRQKVKPCTLSSSGKQRQVVQQRSIAAVSADQCTQSCGPPLQQREEQLGAGMWCRGALQLNVPPSRAARGPRHASRDAEGPGYRDGQGRRAFPPRSCSKNPVTCLQLSGQQPGGSQP